MTKKMIRVELRQEIRIDGSVYVVSDRMGSVFYMRSNNTIHGTIYH